MTRALRYSATAILLLIVCMLCSCSRKVADGSVVPALYPTQSTTSRYDFAIEMGKNAQGGIMVARANDDSSVRLVATTYFGLSLFDLTISPEGYKLNNCIDFLDKEQIWKLLSDDFSQLFLPHYEKNIAKDKEGNLVIKCSRGITSGKITYNPQTASTTIKHKWIGMKLTFAPIENNKTAE